MKLPARFVTARCVMRKPHAGDVEAVHAFASDPRVTRFLGWLPHETLDDTRRQISWEEHRWLKGSACVWLITLADSRRPVGEIELTPQTPGGQPVFHARMGYLLAADQWGRGLMAEVASAALQVAWSWPSLQRVDAVCDVDHPASARVLEKIGMQREGRLRRYILHPNLSAQPRDVWVYSAVRADSGADGSAADATPDTTTPAADGAETPAA